MERIKYWLKVVENILVGKLDAGFVKATGLFISTCIIPLHFKVTHDLLRRKHLWKAAPAESSWKGHVWRESSCVWMFSLFCNLSYNQTILSASTFLKLIAILPKQQLNLPASIFIQTEHRSALISSRKPSSNLNPRLPGDRERQQLLQIQLWNFCLSSSLSHPLPVISSLSSPQLRPVYVHLVASRVQTAEGKIDLTHLSFILMTFWNTFTTAEQTGYFLTK